MKKISVNLCLCFAMMCSLLSTTLIKAVSAEFYETESNNDVSSADNILLNTIMNGAINNYDDIDYYAFSLPANGKINIEFGHDVENDSSSYWNIVLMDEHFNDINEFSSKMSAKMTNMNNIGLPKGKYYIRVESTFFSSNKPYTLKVNYLQASNWEHEYNDDASTANKINVNTKINGSIMNYNDVDYYYFTIADSGKVGLEFEHDTENNNSEYWDIVLMDENFNEINDFSSPMNTRISRMSNLGLPKGKYYVRVESTIHSSNKPYKLNVNYTKSSVWEKEYNNDTSTANKINVNAKVYGSLMNDNDEDYYYFTLSQSGKVAIDFEHPAEYDTNPYWNIYLMDDKYNVIDSFSSRMNEKVSKLDNIGLQKGKYYIRVKSSYNSSNDPYILKVNYTKTTVWEKEFNNSISTANAISIGKKYFGKTADDDEDYYKLNINSSGTYALEFWHAAASDDYNWDIQVINGGTLFKQFEFRSNADEARVFYNDVLSKGTYYIKVSGNTPYYSNVLPYHFKIDKKGVKVGVATKTLTLGKTFQMNAVSTPSSSVTYTVGNNKVAKVDSRGKVTALGYGSTYVTAKSKYGSARTLVKVVKPKPTSVKLNTEKRVITVGKTSQLKATVYPSNASQAVTWRIGNPKIATVDKNGKVTAKSVGGTWLYAKTANGKETKALIKVIPQAKSVKLNTEKRVITVGKTSQLKATVYPSNASQAVTWRIGNPKIATVDKNGKVTAKSVGGTWLYAKTCNGKEAKVLVQVVPLPTGVKIVSSSNSIVIGKTAEYKAIVNPSNASQSVTWRVGNSKIASVDKYGKVTAKSAGKTWLYAKTSNGKEAKQLITITSLPNPQSIQLTYKGYAYMNSVYDKPEVMWCFVTDEMTKEIGIGNKIQFGAVVYPYEAAQSKSWRTGNPKVASVDQNGLLTANGLGSTWLYVKAKNGIEAKILIKVKENDSFTEGKSKRINVGKTYQLSRENSSVYRIGNAKIATVDRNGKVTGKSVGSTWLYATSFDGEESKILIKVDMNFTKTMTPAETSKIKNGDIITQYPDLKTLVDKDLYYKLDEETGKIHLVPLVVGYRTWSNVWDITWCNSFDDQSGLIESIVDQELIKLLEAMPEFIEAKANYPTYLNGRIDYKGNGVWSW